MVAEFPHKFAVVIFHGTGTTEKNILYWLV